MTQSKHTPAPWKAYKNESFWEIRPKYYRGTKRPFSIGDVCASDPHNRDGGLQEANAHLIAASPDLLAALEMAQGVIELGLAEAKAQNAYSGEKIDTHGIKRAVFLAIAKAKGE